MSFLTRRLKRFRFSTHFLTAFKKTRNIILIFFRFFYIKPFKFNNSLVLLRITRRVFKTVPRDELLITHSILKVDLRSIVLLGETLKLIRCTFLLRTVFLNKFIIFISFNMGLYAQRWRKPIVSILF